MPRQIHFHDGAAWRRAKRIYVHDGTAWRQSKSVYVHDGTAWRLSGASAPVNFGGSVQASGLGASAVSASVSFETDGVITMAEYAGPARYSYSAWFDASEAGIGASHWIRATLQAGAVPTTGPGQGVWLPLSQARTWLYSSGTGGASSVRSGTLLFEISANSAGSAIVCSGVFTITADRES